MLDGVMNPLIFPAPEPSYNRRFLAGSLIYIPNFFTTSIKSIPCLYYKPKKSNFVLIHFHANAEDLGHVEQFLKELAEQLNCTVISPEFPGYGIREGSASERSLFETAESVYYFITKSLNFTGRNIVVTGRSVGTSAAMYLASITSGEESSLIKDNNVPFRKTILISPFTSINDMASALFFSGFGTVLKRTLDNIGRAKNLKNDLIVIHGQQDEMVPYKQGVELVQAASSAQSTTLYLRENMSHNSFDFYEDIANPIIENIKDVKWERDTLVIPAVYYKDVNHNQGVS